MSALHHRLEVPEFRRLFVIIAVTIAVAVTPSGVEAQDTGFERLRYQQPLTVDLGVGLWAWPLPMDYDEDGDLDLVVSCPDKPYNGIYFFENKDGNSPFPVFEPAVKIAKGSNNITVSHIDGKPVVCKAGKAFRHFRATQLEQPERLHVLARVHPPGRKLRARQWSLADFNGDGKHDLIIGYGDWTEYGWDNAFNEKGEWTRGPLHGNVYIVLNEGTNEKPVYARPFVLKAGGRPVDVFGMPSPNLADFDGDGDLDLLCGEFRDRLTYFQNVGTRMEPAYAAGRYLRADGKTLRMELCMIVPVAIDWDGDGDVDLIVGEEDGRVAFVENTGKVVAGMPEFNAPRHFQQRARYVKFGALVTPVGFDWDGDGDEDLICGNTAGFIAFLENLDDGDPPRWAAPRRLEVDGAALRIEAGPNGSIQGPAEAKWGYTVLAVADWDHDGLPDLIVNSIWGRVVWYRNAGTRTQPRLTAAQPVLVAWQGVPPKPRWNWWRPQGNELATQWRTSPMVIDLNNDGLNDLVMLDHEGYLAFFERVKRDGALRLLPGRRIFRTADGVVHGRGHREIQKCDAGDALRLNSETAGKSGRRKLVMADWDGDGRRDLLADSVNVSFLRNVAPESASPGRRGTGAYSFKNMGTVSRQRLAGHTTCPTVVDWNKDGVPDLVVGAEDGFLYYLRNPRTSTASAEKRRPNVILIFTDDQGSVDANCYGARDLVTPATDLLAQRGVRFTQFYAAAAVCSPSRAGLLTGRYPTRAGVRGNVSSKRGGAGMPPAQVTIAETFKAAGYATAHIGKWHLGYTPETMPNAQGFDYSYGHMGGCIDNFSHFFYWQGPNRHDLHRNGKEVHEPGKFFPDLMVREASGFMEKNATRPFFIYFALNTPHYPYQGDPQWLERYKDLPYPRNLYAAFISTHDERIGRLLKKIDDLGIREETIVVFQSDHGHSTEERAHFGGGSAGPYRGAKFSMFEGGLRVPAIISWPGKLPDGAVRNDVAHSCDWLPTLAELCGVQLLEKDIDGRSLVPVIHGKGDAAARVLHWHTGNQWAVRAGEWKLIGNPRDTSRRGSRGPVARLFLANLARDVSEKESFAEKHPDVVTRLKKLHEEWVAGIR